MIYAIVVVLVLIADQAVKFWVTKNIVLGATGADCVSLIPGVIHLTDYHNTGAAFSILANGRWLLIGVTVIFIIVIIVLINREIIRAPFGKWMAVLVLAGAIGNCIDRVLYGYVVDMFEVEFMNFAIFNVADIFITVCGVLFCVHIIAYREPKGAVETPKPAPRRRVIEESAKPVQAETPKAEPAPARREEDAAARLARAMRAGNTGRTRAADIVPDYDFGYQQDVPQRRSASQPAKQEPAKMQPAKSEPAGKKRQAEADVPAAAEKPKAQEDEFSLDAIMSEFGGS